MKLLKYLAITLLSILFLSSTVYGLDNVALNFVIGNKYYTSNGIAKEVDPGYDVAPFIQKPSNRTMVPIKCIVEELGGTLEWDSETKSFTVLYGNNKMILTIGKSEATVNDTIVPLDASPVIKNSRSFVPLRFIAEEFNAKVNWDSANQTIDIITLSDAVLNSPQLQKPKAGDKIATLKTNFGDIKILLFADLAPYAVENFVVHAQNGYYDGLIFHRVINDFMIQGGDPLGNGMGGESIWGEPFEDEFSTSLHHYRGALSMANSGANTNGSQFFIVQSKSVSEELMQEYAMYSDIDDVYTFDKNGNGIKMNDIYSKESYSLYKQLGGTPHLDFRHTVFGQVFEGMDIVDNISSMEVVSDKPITDVIINSIEIEVIQ